MKGLEYLEVDLLKLSNGTYFTHYLGEGVIWKKTSQAASEAVEWLDGMEPKSKIMFCDKNTPCNVFWAFNYKAERMVESEK